MIIDDDHQRNIERALAALRAGAGEPLTVKLHGAPEIELHPVDAKPVRAAVQRVLRALQREADRRAP